MGKVASTTISESLNSSRIECYDIHTIRKESLVFQMKKHAENNSIPHNHIGRSINIFRRFQFSKKIKIITCVRDSLSRNISAIFQNLPEKDYSLNELQRIIEKSDPDVPGSWFNNEFFTTTGINVLDKPFDIKAKYGIFVDERFEVLVMRVDLENNIKQQLVSEFIGEEIELTNQNESQNKWYKGLYADFLANGKLSNDWISKCTKSDYMNKFYSKEEQSKYNLKYSKLQTTD
jgi:hypothetical protein